MIPFESLLLLALTLIILMVWVMKMSEITDSQSVLLSDPPGPPPIPSPFPTETRTPSSEELVVPIFQDERGRALYAADIMAGTSRRATQRLPKRLPKSAEQQYSLGLSKIKEGRLSKALKIMREIAAKHPLWAAPVYKMAEIMVIEGAFSEAIKYYEQVQQLHPRGYEQTLTALHSLKAEAAQKLKEGTYLSFLQLDWEANREKRIAIARSLVQNQPQFAPAWRELANSLARPADRWEAVNHGLALESDVDTHENLMINKALLLNLRGKKSEAIAILGTIILEGKASDQVLDLATFTLRAMLSL